MERKLIGVGVSAEVFEYGNDSILKLFKENIDVYTVKREFEISRYAYENKIPTPEPKEIIQENNRNGIIYEKVNGEDLFKVLNPKNRWKILSKMAELQYSINKIEYNNNTHTYKKDLAYAIMESKYFSEYEKEIIKEDINKLPDGNKLIHGDFHQGNVMFLNNEYTIIDWGLGKQGIIAYDAARTAMMIKYTETQENAPLVETLCNKILRNIMARVYINKYCKISGMKKADLADMKLPIYLDQLNFNYSEKEKEKIVRMIKKGIYKRQTGV